MTEAERKEVLERARALLPKYGGWAGGAVNQAMLLVGRPFSVEDYQELVEEVERCGESA